MGQSVILPPQRRQISPILTIVAPLHTWAQCASSVSSCMEQGVQHYHSHQQYSLQELLLPPDLQPSHPLWGGGFIAFSTYPNLAERIKTFYALAPITTLKHSKSPLKKFFLFPPFLFKIIFGNKAFYPHNYFDNILANEVCTREKLEALCSNAIFLHFGFDQKNLNMSRMDVYLSHNPEKTSVQNMLHWSQAVKSDKFQAFDWGNPVQNMRHYHQPTPPDCHLTDINVPIAVWEGGNNWVADPHDVDRLLSKFPKLIYHKRIPSYNHMDFVWGLNAPQEVYNKIVSMIEKDKN
ncbi:gastric triacylglycerol lipase-like [Molossus molossus]|uniref:gastric triacylglycerol lipase-like n=1 Tax=Molossus molossus TaxID=27622 RepID=UPI0017472BF0|nr:gastric triacylglycerol lipase-like [Molossus molossus]